MSGTLVTLYNLLVHVDMDWDVKDQQDDQYNGSASNFNFKSLITCAEKIDIFTGPKYAEEKCDYYRGRKVF